MSKPSPAKPVAAIRHDDAKRRNIPTAEYQPVLDEQQKKPQQVRYPRNPDLDPQLVWRGKDEQDEKGGGLAHGGSPADAAFFSGRAENAIPPSRLAC